MIQLKKTLLMMAVEKETFKIGDKTFQIIEVKEAEQPQPDYSHLVGKFVRCIKDINIFGVKQDGWYQVDHIGRRDFPIVIVGNGTLDSRSWTEHAFDLTNPQDENPDEVKKILVPSEIGVRKGFSRNILGLSFGESQYLVSPIDLKHPYLVWGTEDASDPIQCELIKCERAELKKGDLAFYTDTVDVDLEQLSHYCVIIDETKFCHINYKSDVDVVNVSAQWKHWYKLQPIQ